MSPNDGDRPPGYPMTGATALAAPAEWAELRRRCPVARVTLPSGDEASLLTRYEDVRPVLSDGRFSRQLNAEGAARFSVSDSGGVRRLASLDLAVAAEDVRRLEGPPAGGLSDVPVRW